MNTFLCVPAMAGALLAAPPALAQHAGHAMPPVPPAAKGPDHAQHDGHAQPAMPPSPAAKVQDHSQHGGHMMPPATPPAAGPDHAGHASHAAASSMMAPSGHGGSGTALLPPEPMTGLHATAGGWQLMAHGYTWGAHTDQSGPRGDAMAFVQTMAMLTADREIGGGTRLQLRAMASLEPLMGRRGYPNLLATGETAFGRPLVDRQHPHDLFMELAARVDIAAGDGTVFVYGGPVGEPALGPAAFMHRPSARYLPLAPITHHWFDSTHITYGVATVGYRAKMFQVEGSVFTGREPDEERWGIERPRFDSFSVRATLTPSPRWTMQVSHGRLKEPEAIHPGEDEARTTASVHYGGGPLAATIAFSAKDREPGPVLTAWLAEATWRIGGRHAVFGRVENVANDELFPDHDDPLHDRKFRVSRAEAGYAYRLPIGEQVELALGGSVLGIAVPRALDRAYGDGVGYTLFAKLSLGQ